VYGQAANVEKMTIQKFTIMDRYKVYKIKKYNWWFGLFSGSINIKNVFILHWQWLRTQMHPETRFGFTILGFVLPVIERHRCLLGFHFYTWRRVKKCGSIGFRFFYLPELEFIIGNGKTWWYIRCQNLYAWKLHRQNIKDFKTWGANT